MPRRIILGPPGTGKTTKLLDLVDSHLVKGDKPEEIGFISFTRRAVNEAVDRAVSRFHLAKQRFRYFRTIHSLCFRQLGLSPVEVMSQKDYRELGGILGMKITGIRRQDQMSYELDEGEQCIFLESLSRMKCQSLKDTWSEENVDVDWRRLELVSNTLASYKKTNLVTDFTDMLTRFVDYGHAPKLKVLFVDEAQDLCRLQWNIVEKLAENADIVYIAGDDDQAIFRWSGADVEYFLDLKGETEVLRQSYRVPKSVYGLSQDLIRRIDKRHEKIFTPCDREGSIDYPSSLEDIDMSEGDWLVLVRNGYQARPIVEHCRREGLYYQAFNESPKRGDALRAVITYERLRAGETLLYGEVEPLSSYQTKKALAAFGRHLKVEGAGAKAQARLDGTVPVWHEGLDRLNAEDREYFIACRRRGEKLLGEPRIRVSTIHGAKGGEANNVALFTDISVRTSQSAERFPDDEVRVFYVGATRAIENLYVVQPQTRVSFPL